MNKKQKVHKLNKLLVDFEAANNKANALQKQMVILRQEIRQMPDTSDERPDELLMKETENNG